MKAQWGVIMTALGGTAWGACCLKPTEAMHLMTKPGTKHLGRPCTETARSHVRRRRDIEW
jgi:hypothetical protein